MTSGYFVLSDSMTIQNLINKAGGYTKYADQSKIIIKNSKKILIMTPASLRTNYISEIKKCGDPIYKSPIEPQIPHAHLGRYKTLSYGRLEALAESDVRRGTPHQFKWEGSIDEAETFVPIGKRKDSEYSKYGFKEGKDGEWIKKKPKAKSWVTA